MKFPFVKIILSLIFVICLQSISYAQNKVEGPMVQVAEGRLEGSKLSSGVIVFKGVPYAAPPVGNLRWKAPAEAPKWTGTRTAKNFGARPMQESNLMYEFRSKKSSEDCLYLNIWTSQFTATKLKPVYVFIHGGSFLRGDGSQPAYDGESMAANGIVYISINYRLGIFGFMAHPELSKETGHGSGNYGLLDQIAALKWIKKNISAFGGDPNAITIGGESVGSQSVSAHLASPLSNDLFVRAIAESGSLLDFRPVIYSLAASEKLGVAISNDSKAEGIAFLRSLSAKKILKMATKGDPRRFKPTIDGYFLKENPMEIFRRGEQAKIPLLVGWNANEVPSLALFRLRKQNEKNFRAAIVKYHGKNSAKVEELYPITTKGGVKLAASEFMSDYTINYGAWNFADLHASSGNTPVYRYLFAHPHPGLSEFQLTKGNPFKVAIKGLINKMIKGSAFHASEIEYALGNLDVQPNYAWKNDDYIVSAQLQSYFVNFIKTGNPNGMDEDQNSLAPWPKFTASADGKYLRVGVKSYAETDGLRNRYLLLREIVEGNREQRSRNKE